MDRMPTREGLYCSMMEDGERMSSPHGLAQLLAEAARSMLYIPGLQATVSGHGYNTFSLGQPSVISLPQDSQVRRLVLW